MFHLIKIRSKTSKLSCGPDALAFEFQGDNLSILSICGYHADQRSVFEVPRTIVSYQFYFIIFFSKIVGSGPKSRRDGIIVENNVRFLTKPRRGEIKKYGRNIFPGIHSGCICSKRQGKSYHKTMER